MLTLVHARTGFELEHEVRASDAASFSALVARSRTLLGDEADGFNSVALRWRDEKGDLVTIASDAEYKELLGVARAAGWRTLRFEINAAGQGRAGAAPGARAENMDVPVPRAGLDGAGRRERVRAGSDIRTQQGGAAPAVHYGITCDASGMSPIIGTRYSLPGRDYDICEAEFLKLDVEARRAFVPMSVPVAPEDMAETYSSATTASRSSTFSGANGVPLGATIPRQTELMDSRRYVDQIRAENADSQTRGVGDARRGARSPDGLAETYSSATNSRRSSTFSGTNGVPMGATLPRASERAADRGTLSRRERQLLARARGEYVDDAELEPEYNARRGPRSPDGLAETYSSATNSRRSSTFSGANGVPLGATLPRAAELVDSRRRDRMREYDPETARAIQDVVSAREGAVAARDFEAARRLEYEEDELRSQGRIRAVDARSRAGSRSPDGLAETHSLALNSRRSSTFSGANGVPLGATLPRTAEIVDSRRQPDRIRADVDPETERRIQEIVSAKDRAVAADDFEEATRLKREEEALRGNGRRVNRAETYSLAGESRRSSIFSHTNGVPLGATPPRGTRNGVPPPRRR